MNAILLALVPSIFVAIIITYKTDYKHTAYIPNDQEDNEIYTSMNDNVITV